MMNRKKTLVLTENFPPHSGGSGRWFWELYSRLPEEEYLIVADTFKGAENFDRSHELNVIRLPLKSSEWGVRSKQGLSYYWRTFWALRKIIKQHKITHIHCGRVIHEGVTAWLLKCFTGIKYLCYVHGEDVETAATSREHNLLVKQVCKGAELIVCNSHNSEAIVKRLGYDDGSKIKVLHPGVDTDYFSPAASDQAFRKQVGWEGKLVLLTVGRLQRRKGQDYMIKAMAVLKEQFPNLLYCIIGSGELKEELEQSITDLNLTQFVQLLCGVSDQQMLQYYQQCDLFILPNRTIEHDVEGFGMVLIEAQACGKPVIAGSSGGTRETMEIGSTGHIISCDSPHQIVAALSPALENREQLEQFAHNGRDFAMSHFDWKVHVEKAQRLFNHS